MPVDLLFDMLFNNFSTSSMSVKEKLKLGLVSSNLKSNSMRLSEIWLANSGQISEKNMLISLAILKLSVCPLISQKALFDFLPLNNWRTIFHIFFNPHLHLEMLSKSKTFLDFSEKMVTWFLHDYILWCPDLTRILVRPFLSDHAPYTLKDICELSMLACCH